MYSTAFWCLFVVLLIFLALLCNRCYPFCSMKGVTSRAYLVHRVHDIRLHAFIGDCLTAKQNIPDLHTTIGFCCETLHQFWCETFTVIAYWPRTTTGLCCGTLHQFWCETFTVIAWLTTYDYWLLLWNFAPVLVWNFYGDCLNDYLRLLAFAAKLLGWLSDDIPLLWLRDGPTTTGFCCEPLHQFRCETFTVIAWLTTYDYWL